MSKCPKCGDNHATLLMVWMDGRDLLKCEKCGQQYMFPAEMPKMTNGDKIRQMSNEELAELLVYETMDSNGFFWYTSNILNGVQYEIIPDAVEATVAKLNEVADGD